MTDSSTFGMWRTLILSVLSLVEMVRAQSAAVQGLVTFRDSDVLLNCEISQPYNGPFEWRTLKSDVLGGQQIYSSPPYKPTPEFPSPKYQKSGDFGLRINPISWQDGAAYTCFFLLENKQETTNVVVMDEPTVWSAPTLLTIGQAVNFSCTVMYGGPEMDPASTEISGILPRLRLSLGIDRPLDMTSAYEQRDPGSPGTKRHRLTVTLSHVVTSSDIGRNLVCAVITTNPEFSRSVEIPLDIRVPVEAHIEPLQTQYAVGDVINCSASGWPVPSTMWSQLSGPPRTSVSGSSLKVVDEMKGEVNVWRCTVRNTYSSDEMDISFNVSVVTGDDLDGQENTEGAGSNVGLAVGLTLGLIAIFAIGGIVVFLFIRKRKCHDTSGGTGEKKIHIPFMSPRSNGDGDHRPNGRDSEAPPIYQPRPNSLGRSRELSNDSDSSFDRSGYGDLRLGVPRPGLESTSAAPRPQKLDESSGPGGSDLMRFSLTRPTIPPNGQQTLFSPVWPAPPPDRYTNVPPFLPSDNWNPEPQTPSAMGFADIAGGLHGSRQSLDRYTDPEGRGPIRGSNRSLNRSQDSQTAAMRQPRTVRGSNRSLNRSMDDADTGPRKHAPISADDASWPAAAKPPHPSTVRDKPRPAMKPPPPPKKPEIAVLPRVHKNVDDDDEDAGTEV